MYSVNWYDSDCFGRLSFPGFARFIEESAWRHANELGFGLNDALDGGVVWVIVRLELDIAEIPRWGETVSILTWPRGVDRLFAYREFEIAGSDGRILARATSTWIVIDRKERKAVKPSIVDAVLPYVDKSRVMNRDAARLSVPSDKVLAGTREVRFSDIDTNGHVNNCKYLEWVLDLMEAKDIEKLSSCNISLNFVSELMSGDGVDIFTRRDADSWFFEGVALSSGKTVFIVNIKELV
jgi:acyl-ACP thioesterase